MKRKAIDLSGVRFGRLIALTQHRIGIRLMWLCRCDCGNERFVQAGNLQKQGGTKSCGCLNLERFKAMIRTHGKKTRA
jgi:hypothetical protein